MSHLIAKRYYSGFPKAHDTYNALSAASDGNIYYVLSSDSIEVGGQMYRYNPTLDQTEFLADLTDICGEADANAIPQGKVMCVSLSTTKSCIFLLMSVIIS